MNSPSLFCLIFYPFIVSSSFANFRPTTVTELGGLVLGRVAGGSVCPPWEMKLASCQTQIQTATEKIITPTQNIIITISFFTLYENIWRENHHIFLRCLGNSHFSNHSTGHDQLVSWVWLRCCCRIWFKPEQKCPFPFP